MSRNHYELLIMLTVSAITSVLTAKSKDNDVMGEWGQWGSWSKCSRPCGIGVTVRYRECNIPDRYKNKMKNTCIGKYKQLQTCNKQACSSGTKDIRFEQCEQFNSKLIGGKRYSWEPYNNGGNHCKLYCRAKGQRYFAKLPRYVIDGTPCTQGDIYHICVSGKCKKIGCDGVLGSDLKFDKCGVCGGDNTTCHIISGIFTRTRLRYGYNHVTHFPKGACNINITEMFPSNNYLALRLKHGRYLVNGNRALGHSKDYTGAGTVIKYYRPDPKNLQQSVEYIYIKGPTNHSLDLMVGVPEDTKDPGRTKSALLKQTDNRGIMYSYTIPMEDHHKNTSRHKHRHHSRDHIEHKGNASLTYKVPPKYLEPEYKTVETKQVASLSSNRDKYQRDDPDRAKRYKLYLDQIRQQREESKKRNEQRKKIQKLGDDANSRSGSSINNYNNYNNRQASQNQQGYTSKKNYVQDNRGVPLAVNNQVGVPLKSDAPQTGGVPLVSQRSYGSGGSSYSRGYQYGRNSYSSQPVPIPAPITDRSRQSQGYNDRRYYSGTVSGANKNYNSRNVQQPRPGPNYGVPQSQPKPQPGINFGVKPGQPLQPNPLSSNSRGVPGQVYHPASHYNYHTNRRTSYINYNQQPVYIPPNYAAQQGVQGFQLGNSRQYSYGQSDGSDRRYYPRRNSNVQLGTLDTTAEYSWKISGFTECSKTCGGGSQDTVIVCVKVNSQTVVTDENCDSAVKPVIQSVVCNNVRCPPAWEAGEWGECSTTCGRGIQTRTVECRQTISSTIQISVSASRCEGQQRPTSRVSCNDDKPCVRWRIGEWSQCSAECGRGQRTREVVCLDSGDNAVPENKCDSSKPRSVEICDMGSCAKTWFFTEWSKQCSSECGEGYHNRDVYCSASPERCASIRRPEDKKPCRNDIPCGGKWFTGPWSKCSAICGKGVLSRDVICMKKSGRLLAVVGVENCLEDDKPTSTKPCSKNPCKPQWYMTKWTECSRSCDTGTQTREAKCLDPKQEQSTECLLQTKPRVRQSCNEESCAVRTQKKNKKKDNDSQCKDQYKNCILVVQARLCQYKYYKDICCKSCSTHESNHHHEDDT